MPGSNILNAFLNAAGGDRYDLHAQPPGEGGGEEPVAEASVVPAMEHARAWPVSRSTMGGNPRLVPDPCAGFRITEVPHGPKPVFVGAKHPRAQPVHLRQGQEAGFGRAALTIHKVTVNAAAVSDTARETDDRINELVPGPGGGAGTALDLGGRFE